MDTMNQSIEEKRAKFKKEIANLMITMIEEFISEKKEKGIEPTFELMIEELKTY